MENLGVSEGKDVCMRAHMHSRARTHTHKHTQIHSLFHTYRVVVYPRDKSKP